MTLLLLTFSLPLYFDNLITLIITCIDVNYLNLSYVKSILLTWMWVSTSFLWFGKFGPLLFWIIFLSFSIISFLDSIMCTLHTWWCPLTLLSFLQFFNLSLFIFSSDWTIYIDLSLNTLILASARSILLLKLLVSFSVVLYFTVSGLPYGTF